MSIEWEEGPETSPTTATDSNRRAIGQDTSPSRRTFLTAIGGVAFLSGCRSTGRESSPTETFGDREVTQRRIHEIIPRTLEKFTPNRWHPATGCLPQWQRLPLATIPETYQLAPGERLPSVILPLAAREITIDANTNRATITLREDLSWSDGTAFDGLKQSLEQAITEIHEPIVWNYVCP